jgi:undecaprenyl phosphate-alpha-L-ara4N flippase subunit ArnF
MASVTFGYGLALLTALIVLVGDYLIKLAADGGMPVTSSHVILGCVFYGGSALIWYGSMRFITLAQAGVAFSMFSLLALCALGVLFFDEQIYPREALGIGLALVSMVLMVRIA